MRTLGFLGDLQYPADSGRAKEGGGPINANVKQRKARESDTFYTHMSLSTGCPQSSHYFWVTSLQILFCSFNVYYKQEISLIHVSNDLLRVCAYIITVSLRHMADTWCNVVLFMFIIYQLLLHLSLTSGRFERSLRFPVCVAFRICNNDGWLHEEETLSLSFPQ